MKRLFCILLLLALLLTIPANAASANNSYVINGVTVRHTSVPFPGKSQCWLYASRMYTLIWGRSFNSLFEGTAEAGYNMLRGLPDEYLTFTEEHLKAYITHAELGACIRICDKQYLHAMDDWGHSLILVQKDENGFTTFDSLNTSTRERYWTWTEFYQAWSSNYLNTASRYAYIKYIKWPYAPAITLDEAFPPPTVCDSETCTGKLFNDMPAVTNWAHEGIDYVVDAGLFNGTSKTTFTPAGAMTRAMMVTILWRLEGSPAPSSVNAFEDIAENKYYTDAVTWANEVGLVNGVSETRFKPNGNITREQMATLLFRYTQFRGIETDARSALTDFPDGDKTASYAKEGLSWAVAVSLVQGSAVNGVDYLLPQSVCTRAQVSTLIMRYLETL